MMSMNLKTRTDRFKELLGAWRQLAEDESGIAMTEYIIVFSLVTIGATTSLMATALYIKAYRDFMVWWLAHPAI